MATQHQTPEGPRVIVKGAPEEVLRLCRATRANGHDIDLGEAGRQAVREAAERMGRGALRVLAIGVADGVEVDGRAGFEAFANRVSLLGLVGQLDPPRPEVKDAVERCRDAGIKPVMVTGDHRATGHAVARELGIAREGDLAVDGPELDAMSEDRLAERLDRISVFARVHPAQKLRIVAAYQARRDVVAMTGDGVNDAPALVRANVGVAMGITGTDVAKESAEIVIGDDNFATIVAAIEEGRVVYRNIKKAVLLLLSTSAAEVTVLVLAMSLGYPAPFAAVQILWNNLVTEGLVTVNLVMDPPEGDEMQRPPIQPDEPLLGRSLLVRMAFMAPTIVAVTLGWFIARISSGVPVDRVRTETFTLLAICEWFNVLNCRSERATAFSSSALKNLWLLGGLVIGNVLQAAVVYWRPLARLFHTVPIGPREVIALGLVGSVVLWVEELRKLVARRELK
jgi:Ca2+-transporting ATPase